MTFCEKFNLFHIKGIFSKITLFPFLGAFGLINVAGVCTNSFIDAYIVDPIIKKEKKNNGELTQYYVENSHEAIITMEQYEAVQKEFERRRKLGVRSNQSLNITCFTSKIKCPLCGKNYRRSGKKIAIK